MFERITFGRPSSFIIEGLVATVPIIFALLLQVKPTFFSGYETISIGSLALVLFLVISLLDYWILSTAGSCTYSPALHSRRFIGESVICYQILSIILVYIGYLVLIFPTDGGATLGVRDVLAGIGISALFSILMVSAHSTAVLSLREKSEKERLISEFLSESQKYTSASSAINADEEKVIEAANSILRKLEDEPMWDVTRLQEDLREWTVAFDKYQVGGRQKMVGGVSNLDSLSKPWDELYEQYRNSSKKLSSMHSSSNCRINDG